VKTGTNRLLGLESTGFVVASFLAVLWESLLKYKKAASRRIKGAQRTRSHVLVTAKHIGQIPSSMLDHDFVAGLVQTRLV
jgi:hypothetical protein